jgi:Ca2+-binding EF-hand superfamily protein
MQGQLASPLKLRFQDRLPFFFLLTCSLQAKLSEEQLAELKEAFSLIDQDGSGVLLRECRCFAYSSAGAIELKELQVAMKAVGVTLRKEELNALFAQVDSDHSGTVTFEVAVWLYTFIRCLLTAAIQEFAEMMTGRMSHKDSEEELNRAFDVRASCPACSPLTYRYVSQLFDANRTGRVALADLARVAREVRLFFLNILLACLTHSSSARLLPPRIWRPCCKRYRIAVAASCLRPHQRLHPFAGGQ